MIFNLYPVCSRLLWFIHWPGSPSTVCRQPLCKLHTYTPTASLTRCEIRPVPNRTFYPGTTCVEPVGLMNISYSIRSMQSLHCTVRYTIRIPHSAGQLASLPSFNSLFREKYLGTKLTGKPGETSKEPGHWSTGWNVKRAWVQGFWSTERAWAQGYWSTNIQVRQVIVTVVPLYPKCSYIS